MHFILNHAVLFFSSYPRIADNMIHSTFTSAQFHILVSFRLLVFPHFLEKLWIRICRIVKCEGGYTWLTPSGRTPSTRHKIESEIVGYIMSQDSYTSYAVSPWRHRDVISTSGRLFRTQRTRLHRNPSVNTRVMGGEVESSVRFPTKCTISEIRYTRSVGHSRWTCTRPLNLTARRSGRYQQSYVDCFWCTYFRWSLD